MSQPAILVLADGTVFHGTSVGIQSDGEPLFRVGEVVFNTALTGYQEILTDPSYSSQIITFTYPHIGNVGINFEDFESKQIRAMGLVMRDMALYPSNWRQEQPLSFFLKAHNVVAISGIDTRKLTRLLRDKGSQKGCIAVSPVITQSLVNNAMQQINAWSGLQNKDLAQVVTTHEPYVWNEGGTWQGQSKSSNFHVVALDFGIKHTILRRLHDKGCKITVVPAKTSANDILKYEPNGVFLSNGPGDPEPCLYAIHTIQELLKVKIPIFGICLGHQLLALACGAKTVKMKFGHHGGNHPVIDLATNKVMITSQNHGFAVEEASLGSDLIATHRSLFDGSLQGIKHRTLPAFSFQGHPEAGPGPNDCVSLFDTFIEHMQVYSKLCQKEST